MTSPSPNSATFPLDAEAERAPLVLVAEDDAATAEMLEMILHRVGYDVRIAADGAAALRMVEEMPAPDVVLLDWMLPEVPGVEVCRRIREKWDALSLPILMVTARADPESVALAFEAGASDYITKPFLGAELRARVASQLSLKRMAEDRRRMDEHLMEREKLSTLGLLVSGVAHDLNNPLGGIYGYAQLLREQELEPEKLVALEQIVREVQRCNRIVADLLSFARRHSPERTEVDVGEVLAATLQLRERHLAARGISARLCLDPDLNLIHADAHQLQQVFLNILLNAEHALRESGQLLRITAEHLPAQGEGDEEERVVIRFFNDGPPIPGRVMARIFDPFFTTKGKEEGTGLGLAICRRIVREHGGDIEVESGHEGTTFIIQIPTDPARAGSGAEAYAGRMAG
jgi:two-component system, NtrC family, sensor kinase